MKMYKPFLAALCFAGLLSSAMAQETVPPEPKPPEPKSTDDSGMTLPDSERIRVRVRFMGGYGLDESQSGLGFEKQGRVGYAEVDLFGNLSRRFSYRLEINPVNENQPLPACGEENFFFPNTPQSFGPTVVCNNNGRMRVDDYRFIALDPLMQQGPVRQAYLMFSTGPFGVQFGRFILPIGFRWDDVGSFSAKDATHIQRIDAEASFGVRFLLKKRYKGRDLGTVSLAGVIGDGNKYHDYDYIYGIEGSLDSNSWPTMVLSGTLAPVPQVELRAALKLGDTGSKIERLPNFYASKRNDNALVMSVRYRPFKQASVWYEHASYTWGLKRSSAELLGLRDTDPVHKAGYNIGVELTQSLTKRLTLGTTLTREELSRDDALIKYLVAQNLYGVSMGKKERSTVYRFYLDVNRAVRVGVFRNVLSNPFPWVSGIQPVAGPNAFRGRGNNKWGVIVSFVLQ
jgi:hypothetical protein